MTPKLNIDSPVNTVQAIEGQKVIDRHGRLWTFSNNSWTTQDALPKQVAVVVTSGTPRLIITPADSPFTVPDKVHSVLADATTGAIEIILDKPARYNIPMLVVSRDGAGFNPVTITASSIDEPVVLGSDNSDALLVPTTREWRKL